MLIIMNMETLLYIDVITINLTQNESVLVKIFQTE